MNNWGLAHLFLWMLLAYVFRSAVTFICGAVMYMATWVLLGQSKEDSLSPKVWKQFMVRKTLLYYVEICRISLANGEHFKISFTPIFGIRLVMVREEKRRIAKPSCLAWEITTDKKRKKIYSHIIHARARPRTLLHSDEERETHPCYPNNAVN